MKSYGIYPITDILIRKKKKNIVEERNRHRHTQGEKAIMKTEQERCSQRLLATARNQEKARKCSQQLQEATRPNNTLILDFSAPRTMRE